MLASGLQTLSLERESNTVSRCVRPWIKFIPEYPFNRKTRLSFREQLDFGFRLFPFLHRR